MSECYPLSNTNITSNGIWLILVNQIAKQLFVML